MLEVLDLEVAYGPVEAVRGVSLEVSGAEAVGLVGPNGAGKTSLLRALSGLERYRGTVRLDGLDLRGMPAEAIARAGLLHVPEGRRVYGTLDVHENLQTGLSARNGRTGGLGLDDVYDLFPALQPLRKRGGWALSGGEQQMVAIGRALVGAPRLLLLDEPSLGLAPVVTQALYEALEKVSRDVPMLIVEQTTSIVLRSCARAYVLASGTIALSGTSDQLTDRKLLLDSYLGQRDGGRYEGIRANRLARRNGGDR